MQIQIPPKMLYLLRNIYGLPASITLISGNWKTGKTDFALMLTELLKQIHVIDEFSSNIQTEDHSIQFVGDFAHFDFWLYSNKSRKMFLYDEVVESSPRRSAMSALNVAWVRRIPQLSKGRCHLIAITQELSLTDSVFLNPVFLRAHWRKLNKTNVIFYSSFLNKNIHFSNIPRTSIKFDPYLQAQFKLDDASYYFQLLPLPLKVLTLYGEGKSMEEIGRETKLYHKEKVRRELRKACKAISVTMSQDNSEGKEAIKICDELTEKDH